MKTKMIALGLFSLLAAGQAVQARDYDRVPLAEEPVPVSAVKDIAGFFGERMEVNRRYLKTFPIDRYVDFVVERQHTDWDWTRAEQHGKWIESAYLSAIQAGDTVLMEKAREVLHRIVASQEESGYLGATARSYRTAERPVRGMDAYELYFVFHALVTVYEETGDRNALAAAERLAGYYLHHFGPGKLEFWPSALRYPENRHKEIDTLSDFAGHGVHYSWEGTLLCDPVARLYEVTGKKKYLDWSLWVVENIDKWSGWDAFSRLDSVADGKLGIDQLQPYVHAHTFQMNFMGFLRLYRITGDKSLLHKVQGAWNYIHEHQMYITGGVSVAEHYEHGYVKPLTGNIVETCATMSWMQLTQMLLELTGETRYADAMERLMLNHVFAAQDCETGVCRYHTAPNGDKPSGRRGYFHGPDCCTASGHRVISLLPAFFFAEKGSDFFVNQYLPCRYEGKGFAFEVAGGYPETETVTLDVTSARRAEKTLHLRIPAWCASPRVEVNGQVQEGIVPGSYCRISRSWSKGDRVTLTFPMKVQWHRREHHGEYTAYTLPKGEIMYREAPASRVPYALTRGPLVYCLDMVWNKQLGNDDVQTDKDIRIDITAAPVPGSKPYAGLPGPTYRAKAFYKGSPAEVLFTPFTGSSQWFRPGESKPHKQADAFTYAVWLYPAEAE